MKSSSAVAIGCAAILGRSVFTHLVATELPLPFVATVTVLAMCGALYVEQAIGALLDDRRETRNAASPAVVCVTRERPGVQRTPA